MAYGMPIQVNRRKTLSYAANRDVAVLPRMTHDQSAHHHSKLLRIMQYNVAKRREVMESILNDKGTQEYSLLLMQEHCHTYKQKTPLLHQSWTAIEPTLVTERPPRAAIYV